MTHCVHFHDYQFMCLLYLIAIQSLFQMFSWANNSADFVLPVYCFDPRHFQSTYHFKLPKTGYHRAKFLVQSVIDLKQTLQKRGSDLHVEIGHPEEVIPCIIKKIGQDKIMSVAFQQEVTKEELDVETALKAKCDMKTKTFWGFSLYHKDDLPFDVQKLPDVYTQFRKSVEGSAEVRNLATVPEQFKPLPEGLESTNVPTLKDIGFNDEPTYDVATRFSGGETEALSRLRYYLWESDKVATYKETRNGLIGEDYSTKFSPWLALGCISPRQIYWEIQKYEKERTSNQSTYWVIFELLWRDYFRFVAIKYGDIIFYEGGIQNKTIPWKKDESLFNAWKEGKTGVPFVDANMREMAQTGFMSNRGRQNVASFLTKDLHLDWRLGAEWFESALVDHDVTSNYGNWLYSAGIGNDPREDRKFNIIKQGLDYDPEGDYIRLWIPELGKISSGAVHAPWLLSSSKLSAYGIKLGDNYPNPVLTAPEWKRHYGKLETSGASGRSGGQQKKMDSYFKRK